MQIYQDQPVKGSLQDSFGTGLQQLMQLKLGQLQQRHMQKQAMPGLQALGIPQDTAEQLSKLSPELQSVVVKSFLQGAETAGLSEALGGLSGQQQPTGARGIGVAPTAGAQFSPEQQILQETRGPKTFEEVLKNPRLKPEHRLRIAEMQQRKDLAAQKIAAGEKKEARKELLAVDKEYRPFIKQTHEEYKGVVDDTRRLDRMETLVKSGKLSGPKVAAGLDFLEKGATIFLPHVGGVHLAGLNFKSVLSPESAEFEKLSNDFVKNAKSVFGSRITDNDLKVFMSTVPTMMMNDQGKLRVIHNMRLYNEGIKARYDAMRDVLKENGGIAPRNFELLIEDRAQPRLDAIAKKFALGIPEEPKPQKSITSKLLKLDNPLRLFSA